MSTTYSQVPGVAEQGDTRPVEATKQSKSWFRRDMTPVGSQEMEKMSTPQLLRKAATLNRDTTRTAQNALKILEETKEMSSEIMASMEKDGENIKRINEDLDKVNEDIYYSEKLIRYMSSYCWFCICCWDPESARRRELRDKQQEMERMDKEAAKQQREAARHEKFSCGTAPSSGKGLPLSTSEDSTAPMEIPQQADMKKVGSSRFAAVPSSSPPEYSTWGEISLGDDLKVQERALNKDIVKQNAIIDRIGDGLDDLLETAKAMNTELEDRAESMEKLDEKIEYTMIKVERVTKQASSFQRKF